MTTEPLTVTSAAGKTWNVTYGQRTRFTERPTVNFYDADADERFPEIGQFVAEYYPEEITSYAGLNLDGGVPEWRIDAETMDKIRTWVREQIKENNHA